MNARVVKAGREHLESVVRIERESFSDPWSHQTFARLIESPLALLLIGVTPDETVVGYAATAAGVREEGEILNVAVDRSARAMGIGGLLLDAALSALRDQLADDVFLEVRASNAAAIALYSSRGFRQIAVRRGYYRRPVEDALVMRLKLKPSP